MKFAGIFLGRLSFFCWIEQFHVQSRVGNVLYGYVQ